MKKARSQSYRNLDNYAVISYICISNLKRKESIMRYVIFYDIAGIQVFSISDKKNSCFLTKKEAQERISEELFKIPGVRIKLLKKATNIRKDGWYWVLSRVGTEQRGFKVVESRFLNGKHEGERLLKDKIFVRNKLIMEDVDFQIKARIKE